jgi:membrane protein DedA with SNARE-associated domain
MSALGFALAFWLAAVFLAGIFVFVVGEPQSDEPASAGWGALLLIPLVVGAVYGWRRSRRSAPQHRGSTSTSPPAA